MQWRVPRLPLLIAWLLILGILAYLGTHPRLVTPVLSRIVSRNLFHDADGSLRVRDFRWQSRGVLDLYDLSVSFKGQRGGVTVVSVDTLVIEADWRQLLRAAPHLSRVRARGGEIFVHQAASDSGAPFTAPSWPRLRIDYLQLADFSVEVSDVQGRLVERVPRLDWRGVVHAADRLRIESRDADVIWESRRSRLRRLHGQAVLDADGVALEDVHVQLNESDVTLAGRVDWDGELDLRVEGRGVSAVEIEEILDERLGFVARGDLDGHFVGYGDTLLYAGTFTGELEGYDFEAMWGRAVIAGERVDWRDLSGRVNGAHFDGGGEIDVSDPHSVAFVLAGEVADLDLSRGLVPGEELPPSHGHGSLTIRYRERPRRTHVTGSLLDGYLEVLPFDTCLVDVLADTAGVDYRRIDMRHRGQRAVLTGRSDTSRVFAGELQVAWDDLSRLPESWGWPPLTGRLEGRGTLRGPVDDLTFTGRVEARSVGLAPLAADTLAAELVVDRVLGDPEFTVYLAGDGLAAGEVPLGAYRLTGRASTLGAELEEFLSERGDTLIQLRGGARFADSTVTCRVRELAVDLEGNRWRLQEPLVFTLSPGALTVPDFQIASAHGSFRARGRLRSGEMATGKLELRRFDLGLLNPLLQLSRPLGGQATADIQLGGTPEEPVLELTADVVGFALPEARLDSLHATGRFESGDLVLDRLWLATDHGRLIADGSVSHRGTDLRGFWSGATLALTVRVEDGDWDFVDQFDLPALDRLAGRYDAELAVGGTTRQPVIEGTIHSEPFHVHWLHLDTLTGRLRVDSEQMVLSELVGSQDSLQVRGRIEVPLRFDLLSAPQTPPDGPFLMRLAIAPGSPLAPLTAATNAFFDCGGRGGASVTIAGPLDHPFWTGDLAVADGSFVLKGLGEIYRDVSFTGTWSGDLLRLRDIRATEGERGTVAGEGTLTFAGLELETFDIDLAVDRFLVASIPDLRVLVRSPLVRLEGVKVGPDSLIVPRFAGELEVIQARYTGDFEEKPGVVDPRTATVAPDWLADIHVVGPPRTSKILNRAMELYMSGDVDLVRDLEGLYLRGSMNIDAGRLPVFNNDFKVVRGGLDFSQEVGLEPQVDMEAETRVRIPDPGGSSILERVTVHVSGSLYEPLVEFSSESGYNREAIERMLLGLSPHPTQGGSEGWLGSTSLAAGFNLLEREIAAGLNIVDTFDIEHVGRRSEVGEPSTLIGVGKYIGQDLYVKYAQGLQEADRDLLVEYQITNHLLLQSEIRRRIDELQGDTTYSLDLKYRFEY